MVEPWIWRALAGAVCLCAFAWLALAMEPHWLQVHPTSAPAPRTRRRLRVLGFGALFASAVLAFRGDRPSIAVLVWVMLLTANVPLIAFILAWRPALLRVFWPMREGGRPAPH